MREDSMNSNSDWLDEAITHAVEIPQHVVNAAWDRLATEHVVAGRLMQLAFGLIEPLEAELKHIHACDRCCQLYNRLRPAEKDDIYCEKGSDVSHTNGQMTLWRRSDFLSGNGNGHHNGHLFPQANRPHTVPDFLREHLQVHRAVVFPGDQVAQTSWQFGLLIQLLKDKPEFGKRILNAICDNAFETLQPRLTKSQKTFVCFGTAMHQCGIELATRFNDSGLGNPHVVLAHDYYEPSLICDPKEFRDAEVVVLVDVFHTGSLLRRVIASCERFSPRRVFGLALIDQDQSTLKDIEYYSLWRDVREDRVPLAQFLRDAELQDDTLIERFEPNSQCAILRTEPIRQQTDNHLFPNVDPQLVVHVVATDALKCDYRICGKRYPFVVNVLDLIKKDDESRQFIAGCSKGALADLAFQKTCLVFNVGRAQRAGQIAKLLSGSTGWPVFPIGTKGTTFRLTDQQCRQIACFDNVVLVDAAIRTGESLTAVTRAIQRELISHHPRLIAFSVLNALSSTTQSQLSSDIGIEIRTLFTFPLTPPTEEVRHWAKAQKKALSMLLVDNPLFAGVHPILRDYCDTSRKNTWGREKVLSRTEKLELAKHAISYGRSPSFNANQIVTACHNTLPRAIRHLPVNEVVHDQSMQTLLMGVMYNSVPPSVKESAVFALAAAENYDWMNLTWLKHNRRFLGARANAWKAVLVVECQMRLNGLNSQLTEFREAAMEYRKSLECGDVEPSHRDIYRGSLFPECMPLDELKNKPSTQPDERVRMAQRLDKFIEIAG